MYSIQLNKLQKAILGLWKCTDGLDAACRSLFADLSIITTTTTDVKSRLCENIALTLCHTQKT